MKTMKFNKKEILFDFISGHSAGITNILPTHENNLKKQDSYYQDDQLNLITFLTIVEKEAIDFFGAESTVRRSFNKKDDMWNLVFSNSSLSKKELLSCLREFKQAYWKEHGAQFFSKVFLSVE